MCPTTTALPPTTTLLEIMKPLDPQVWQALQYLEYRRLRHKPAKIIPCTNGVGVWENAETHETFDTYDEAVASCES